MDIVTTDIRRGVMMELPYPRRIALFKKGCPICAEVIRAVTKFNRLVEEKEKIKIVYSDEIRFNRYRNFFVQLVGTTSIPTPLIFFEGHVMKGCTDWLELYWLLRKLGGMA